MIQLRHLNISKLEKDLNGELQRTMGSNLTDFSDESQQKLFELYIETGSIKEAVKRFQFGPNEDLLFDWQKKAIEWARDKKSLFIH